MVCYCLPPPHDTGIPWQSPIQILPRVDSEFTQDHTSLVYSGQGLSQYTDSVERNSIKPLRLMTTDRPILCEARYSITYNHLSKKITPFGDNTLLIQLCEEIPSSV